MEQGYILIQSELAREQDVYKALVANHSIVEAHSIFGEYAYIVKGEAEDIKQLAKSLDLLPGVRSVKNLGKILDKPRSKILGDLMDKMESN